MICAKHHLRNSVLSIVLLIETTLYSLKELADSCRGTLNVEQLFENVLSVLRFVSRKIFCQVNLFKIISLIMSLRFSSHFYNLSLKHDSPYLCRESRLQCGVYKTWNTLAAGQRRLPFTETHTSISVYIIIASRRCRRTLVR